MLFRTIAALFLLLVACSRAPQQTYRSGQLSENGPITQIKSDSGLTIEYGPNLGTTHTDTLGRKNFYVHSTAIIRNDSTIPIHLQFALSKEYEFPTFCNDAKYKVFLLPVEVTPDTATIYNNIVNGQHEYLDAPLDDTYAFNSTLDPGEYFVVTIGVLIVKPANCAAVPRAVFSNENIGLYSACHRQINQAISTDPRLEIGVKLEYYYKRKFITPEDGCVIIPFGQISYPEQ